MPTPGTPRASFRLPPRTLDQISDLRQSSKAGSVTATAVVIEAIDSLHRGIYGRRSTEMCPVTVRSGSPRAKSRKEPAS